jgi:hypothetical protein
MASDREKVTIRATDVAVLNLRKLFDLTKLVKVQATANVLHKPGAVRLDGYPCLCFAPKQHGDGVRTEDNGTLVADIATAACETPDYEQLAKRFKTSPAHISDAIRYAAETGFVVRED